MVDLLLNSYILSAEIVMMHCNKIRQVNGGQFPLVSRIYRMFFTGI